MLDPCRPRRGGASAGAARRRRRRLERRRRSAGLSRPPSPWRPWPATTPFEAADCDPDEAWACGLLAPLGWLGVCAADPAAAAACLADAEFARNPSQTQRRRWGLDQSALARRLARRWRLPRLADGRRRLSASAAGTRPSLRARARPFAMRSRGGRTGARTGLRSGAWDWPARLRERRRVAARPLALASRLTRVLGIAVSVAVAARPAADGRRKPPAARGGPRACAWKRKSISCTRPWRSRRPARTAG